MIKKSILFLSLAAMVSFFASCEKPGNNDEPGTPAHADKAFSISADKQVYLAPGNLQYRPSANTFRFAANQWEARMEDNLMTSPEFDDWIDNFGWATSGYSNYMPYLSSSTNSAYYHDGNIDGTEYDWGVHNAIQNGNTTDPAGTWRTLSKDEWEYMLQTRQASTLAGTENARFLHATVHGQTGMIIFPDGFEYPAGLPALNGEHINTYGQYSNYTFTESDWNKLEEAGCAFLPAAGCRLTSINRMISMDFLGAYWTSTYYGNGATGFEAYQLAFSPMMCECGSVGLQFSRCVRLAKDVK